MKKLWLLMFAVVSMSAFGNTDILLPPGTNGYATITYNLDREAALASYDDAVTKMLREFYYENYRVGEEEVVTNIVIAYEITTKSLVPCPCPDGIVEHYEWKTDTKLVKAKIPEHCHKLAIIGDDGFMQELEKCQKYLNMGDIVPIVPIVLERGGIKYAHPIGMVDVRMMRLAAQKLSETEED